MKRNKNFDKFIFLPLLIYALLNIPFIGSIPYLDGNIDFVQTYDFYTGGFTKLFINWSSIHPPLKILLAFPFYRLFGINSFAYSLMGPVLGLVGIVFAYLLFKKLFDHTTAKIAVFLISMSPLYISTGGFGLRDFVLAVFILIALYFFAIKKYLYYGLFASLVVLTKETGIVFILSVLAVQVVYIFRDIFLKRPWKKELQSTLFLTVPVLVSVFWFWFLKISGEKSWSDWNFSETANRGTIYTIFYNLISLNFLNKYAFQNWLQLLVLNFNWLHWLTIILGSLFLLWEYSLKKALKLIRSAAIKTVFIIVLFSALYFLSVLSFQTYTIPRYSLPIIPFLLLATSLSLIKIAQKLKLPEFVLFVFLGIFSFLVLFRSLDPVSTRLWGRINVLGEEVYGLNKSLAGNDGITYNIQYARIVKRRSNAILLSHDSISRSIISEDCYWIFPDPNNDLKTALILKLNLNFQNPCVNNQ